MQPVYSTSMPQSWRRPQHHKRTFCSAIAMSALPPKADICGAKRNVRYGPEVDIRDDYERSGSNAAAARGKITLISVNSPGSVSTSIEPPCFASPVGKKNYLCCCHETARTRHGSWVSKFALMLGSSWSIFSLATFTALAALDLSASAESLDLFTGLDSLDLFASLASLDMFASLYVLDAFASLASLDMFASLYVLDAFASLASLDMFASLYVLDSFASLASLDMIASLYVLDAFASLDTFDAFIGLDSFDAFASLDSFDAFVSLNPLDSFSGLDSLNSFAGLNPLNFFAGLDSLDSFAAEIAELLLQLCILELHAAMMSRVEFPVLELPATTDVHFVELAVQHGVGLDRRKPAVSPVVVVPQRWPDEERRSKSKCRPDRPPGRIPEERHIRR